MKDNTNIADYSFMIYSLYQAAFTNFFTASMRESVMQQSYARFSKLIFQ